MPARLPDLWGTAAAAAQPAKATLAPIGGMGDEARIGQRVNLATVLLVVALLLWIGIHYGLIAWALRDLLLRPRVRGGNKIAWALLILIVPVVGPLVYAVYGPASFLPRRVVPRGRGVGSAMARVKRNNRGAVEPGAEGPG